MRVLIILIILTLSNAYLIAQNQNVDSLWRFYNSLKHDTARIKILNEDFGNVYKWINPDSAIFFYKKAIEISDRNISKKEMNSSLRNRFLTLKAISLRYIGNVYINQGGFNDALRYYKQALTINKEINDAKGISSCYTNIGIVYSNLGKYDKALENYLTALKIIEKIKDKNGISLCYINIGVSYSNQGVYDKALEYYFKALKLEDKSGDKKRISACYSNIGIVYKNQNMFDKSLEYYFKALEIVEELGDKYGQTQCYTNIGNIYYAKQEYDKSMEFYQKVLKITIELGDKYGESASYTNIGNIYFNKVSFNKSLDYYLKALSIKVELDDKQGIALLYENIASVYNTLLDSVKGSEKYVVYLEKAIESGEKAITLAHEINAIPIENTTAFILKDLYKKKGNYLNSLRYAEIYISTRDSMFKEEKTKAIAEMETKYQSEKKQLEIDKLAKEKELQASEMKKQRLIILFVVCGLLFVLGFSIVLFRMFIQKKKANKIITEKNEALQIAYEEINIQKEEIIVQRDNIQAQKEIIEEHQKEIEDSIYYAKRIQQAVMPDLEFGSWDLVFGSFILFKPKDIVSGDFYWSTKVNEWLIITVADCTGHGVPGAFMSMLGISFLNEIVRKKEVTQASDVLDQLRSSVIDALKQKGESSEQKDGMDIALCAINTTTLEMQFAGANNPCWVVSQFGNETINQFGNEKEKGMDGSEQLGNFQIFKFSNLVELKPDKQPIGIHADMKSFTNQQYQLQKGDIIYLMSDGFEDQFGGPNRKKFLAKNLKNLLMANSQQPMADQKHILESTINDWIGGNEQIDDITIIGIKI